MMAARALGFAVLGFLCASYAAGRQLLAACPHATSSLWNCQGPTAFIVCLNLCPSTDGSDPCAPCGNPAVTCSSVYQQQSGVTAEYTAVLDTYQYGDICFTATPPAGAITRESTTRGQPAVSQPRASGPPPRYTGIAPSPAPSASALSAKAPAALFPEAEASAPGTALAPALAPAQAPAPFAAP